MSVHFCIVLIMFYSLCVKNSSCAKLPRPSTELYDAFKLLRKFSPMLLGTNVTGQEEALFAANLKKQDVYLGVEKLITKYGYPVERYEVITEDGYILTLFRIRRLGPPVFLMHGLLLSADDWVTPGPDTGLAYMLADEGYDVWMGNARGSKHSCHHVFLSPESPDFWNFSWDEIGRYDLPVMIDFVLDSTNHRQLVYIGHSQGTTTLFVLTSEIPKYNDKIALMIALAPAAAVPNMKNPFFQSLNYLTLFNTNELFAQLRRRGLYVFPSNNSILKEFSKTICGRSGIARALCNNAAFMAAGFSNSHFNFTTLPVILSHLTSDISMKQVEHYAQTLTFQRFQHFDYGEKRNEVLYGSHIPPEYNVGSITTPVVFFYSSSDWLASDVDVQILWRNMHNVTMYKVPDKQFYHLDFVFSKDIKELIFIPMLRLIKNTYYAEIYSGYF